MVGGQQHAIGSVEVDVAVFDHRRVCFVGEERDRMSVFVDRVNTFVRGELNESKSFVAWLLPSPVWGKKSKELSAKWIRVLASLVVDSGNRLQVDMLQPFKVVSLFYGPRLVAVQHIDAANCPNSPLAHVVRFNEQLMGQLQRRCSQLINRDPRNKNMGISGLTLVGESDAMSVLLCLDYDHDNELVCDGEHKVVEIKVESDSNQKKAACKVSVHHHTGEISAVAGPSFAVAGPSSVGTCEVFSDSVPMFRLGLMGFSEEFGEQSLLRFCLSDIGVRSVAAPPTIVDKFHAWMSSRKFNEDFVLGDKTTKLDERLLKFERLVWDDLKLAFQLCDDSADYLLAVLFWWRPYIVWSEKFGNLSEYFSRHNIDIVDVFGKVCISWSLRETTSPEQAVSCQTIAIMSSWASSLIKQHFPEAAEEMTRHGDSIPHIEPLGAECDFKSGSVGVQDDFVRDQVDLANRSARKNKRERRLGEATQHEMRLVKALSSLSKHHERNGDGDLRVSSEAVSAAFLKSSKKKASNT